MQYQYSCSIYLDEKHFRFPVWCQVPQETKKICIPYIFKCLLSGVQQIITQTFSDIFNRYFLKNADTALTYENDFNTLKKP